MLFKSNADNFIYITWFLLFGKILSYNIQASPLTGVLFLLIKVSILNVPKLAALSAVVKNKGLKLTGVSTTFK